MGIIESMKTQMFPSLNARRSAASLERRTIREALFRRCDGTGSPFSLTHFHRTSINKSGKDAGFIKEQAGVHSIEAQCSSHAQGCAGTSQDRKIPQPGIVMIREEEIR
jgi:hypothetical protein